MIFIDYSVSLSHHGVKGMKWGVRKYQNKDGSRTAEGKKHDYELRKTNRAMTTTKEANEIVESLSKKDKKLLGAEQNKPWIDPKFDRETSKNISKRVVEYDKSGKPASFFEIWDDEKDVAQVTVATKSGDAYRGKGYASKAVKKGRQWYDRYGYKHLKSMEWIAKNENVASINLAEKNGFKQVDMKSAHPEWDRKYDSEYTILVYKKGQNAVGKLFS